MSWKLFVTNDNVITELNSMINKLVKAFEKNEQ